MKLLLYCTKAKPYLYKTLFYHKYLCFDNKRDYALNGKIVAECDFEVEDIELVRGLYIPPYLDTYNYVTKTIKNNTLIDKACLTYQEMEKYFGKLNYGGKNGYAIHIKNLHIFDKPRELNDYYNNKNLMKDILEIWENYGLPDKDDYDECSIKKAPQNMCRVFDEKK